MTTTHDSIWTWLSTGQWVSGATRLAVAVGVVAGAAVLARVVVRILRRLRDRSHIGRPLIYIVEKLAGYALVLVGAFIGLSTLVINLTSLAVFAGVVGVGVGLGLQGVVREFVSGLVTIFDPFINVGDFIELENGIRGEVTEVGPRATRIRTNDGLNVILPNSRLIETQVVNWTLKGGTRRIHVPFSVAYGVDKSRVRDVVLEAARGKGRSQVEEIVAGLWPQPDVPPSLRKLPPPRPAPSRWLAMSRSLPVTACATAAACARREPLLAMFF